MPRPHDMNFVEIENGQVLFQCANCGGKMGMAQPDGQGAHKAEKNKDGEWSHPQLGDLAEVTLGGKCNS